MDNNLPGLILKHEAFSFTILCSSLVRVYVCMCNLFKSGYYLLVTLSFFGIDRSWMHTITHNKRMYYTHKLCTVRTINTYYTCGRNIYKNTYPIYTLSTQKLNTHYINNNYTHTKYAYYTRTTHTKQTDTTHTSRVVQVWPFNLLVIYFELFQCRRYTFHLTPCPTR